MKSRAGLGFTVVRSSPLTEVEISPPFDRLQSPRVCDRSVETSRACNASSRPYPPNVFTAYHYSCCQATYCLFLLLSVDRTTNLAVAGKKGGEVTIAVNRVKNWCLGCGRACKTSESETSTQYIHAQYVIPVLRNAMQGNRSGRPFFEAGGCSNSCLRAALQGFEKRQIILCANPKHPSGQPYRLSSRPPQPP